MPLSGYVYCGNCGSRLIAGIDRGNIYYYCRRGALALKKECAASRIMDSINGSSIYGLKDGVCYYFRFFFEKENQYCKQEDNITKNYDINSYINNLYSKYKRKKLTENEYLFLFKNTIDRIIVYADKVVFETKFGIFERKRKTVKRQKGIAKR